MENVWFTSDTHFWHESVLKFCPDTRRGENAEEMTELMIEAWNKLVKPNDRVFHAGDFSFGGVQKITSVKQRLNGQIHLMYGNHCKMIKKKTEIRDMFASVQERKHVRIGDHHFMIDHYPHAEWENAHHGWMMLHGHQHNSGVGVDKRYKIMDIGIDARGDDKMVPHHIDDVLQYMSGKEILPHHGKINC